MCITLLRMSHLSYLLLLLGSIRVTVAKPFPAFDGDIHPWKLEISNVSSPSRNQDLKPVCFGHGSARRADLQPYNDEDCNLISDQLVSNRDERLRPRIYSSGPATRDGHRHLPFLWEKVDCSFVLTAAPGQGRVTVRYSDFDIAIMAGKVRKACGNTDIPLGGFLPFVGPRGEKMALIVERDISEDSRAESADDRGRTQAVAQPPLNISAPTDRPDLVVGCLPSRPSHNHEVDTATCIDLAHELKTGPKSLSQHTYSNDRHSAGRSVPYQWSWRDCRIRLMSVETSKPRSEKFSENEIGDHAAKIIRKCLLDIRGPAIGGMVNMLPILPKMDTEFYIRLDSMHNSLLAGTAPNTSTGESSLN